jgi:hypothetical protein
VFECYECKVTKISSWDVKSIVLVCKMTKFQICKAAGA